MREWVDHMDYSMGANPIPPSHGEEMNSHPDGYVLPSYPSFNHSQDIPHDDMES
jgi:hypothetical protein